MRQFRVLLARRAVGDVGTNFNQRGTISLRLSVTDSVINRIQVIASDFLNMPVIGFKAFFDIFSKSQAGVALDRYVIIIIQVNQFSQT